MATEAIVQNIAMTLPSPDPKHFTDFLRTSQLCAYKAHCHLPTYLIIYSPYLYYLKCIQFCVSYLGWVHEQTITSALREIV
jgi:hypothetical protein